MLEKLVMKHYIGVDIGGTNIKIGIVDEKGKALAHDSFSTDAQAGPQAVVNAISQQVKSLVGKAGMSLDELTGVGIGCPGPLDLKAGIVVAAPNLKTWKNVPLRDMVSKATGLPAILENDANAAAFGEFWAGAGRDENVRHLVMLTLGTGIGCGIVNDGRLIHGKHGYAAETGHTIIQPDGRLCACGQRGCIEAYASARNMAHLTEELLEQDTTSSLHEVFKAKGRISSKDVFTHAKQGDALALKVVDQTTDYLGILCVNLCRQLDPAMIVFAGGMILAGDFLFSRIRKAFDHHTWKIIKDKVTIVPAELGNDAGFIGAAAVAWDGDRHGALVLA
jgi:glucokinase